MIISPRIAIAFEFNTLAGGERSMLAALGCLRGRAEFVAVAPPGGRLATALSERGIETVELALRDGAGRRLPREAAGDELRRAVHRASPDLLHANSLSMGRLTGAIAGELAVPCAAHLRDIIGLSRAAVADLNRHHLLLAVSEATRAYHVAQGLDPRRVRVVYNGVDCEQFAPRPASGALQRELGLSDAAFLVATIGQIGLRKGQDVLAEAAALAAASLPQTHYLLIGERTSSKAESIELERGIVRRFREAGLADRLHRLGFRDDIDRLLSEVDLLVHPARQEPLGRVLLEAAAAGLPIIATAVGGTPEILRDGESARLIPPDDPDALARVMIELHGHPGRRDRLASHARRRAESTFAIAPASDQLWECWSELLAAAFNE